MKKITKEDIKELEDAIVEMQNSMLKEGKLRKGDRDAVPGLNAWPSLNNNNNPYNAYRFGIAMAGAPSTKTDKSGPIGGDFITVAYTDGDEDILKAASKQLGIKSSAIASKTSKEPSDTYKSSPVAKISKNKYGV